MIGFFLCMSCVDWGGGVTWKREGAARCDLLDREVGRKWACFLFISAPPLSVPPQPVGRS